MLKAKQLFRQYGDFVAVNDVSFEIQSKQIVGLLGQNGAGKTTIMKMMTGFLEPSSGSIAINGIDVNQSPVETKRQIGYLPENCPVYSDMSVIEFLLFTARLRNMHGRSAQHAVQQSILKTDLGAKATQNIQTLSRGYRQRVGVAQAILSEPDILILDEPTNGLDPSQIEKMRSLLQELAQTTTVIISTHVLHEVSAVCDRVLILKQGQLALDSSLNELQEDEQLLISVDKPPEQVLPELGVVDTIKDVEYIGHDRYGYSYRIAPANNSSLKTITPEMTRILVNLNYNISRVSPEVRDLETIFREINQSVH